MQALSQRGGWHLLGDRDEVAELAQLDLFHTRRVWIDSQLVLLPGSAGGCTGYPSYPSYPCYPRRREP
jgi:hypothetical protein